MMKSDFYTRLTNFWFENTDCKVQHLISKVDDVLWILWQFSMKLLGLPTTKHFFSFILGCPQDFNFPGRFGMAGVKLGSMGKTAK